MRKMLTIAVVMAMAGVVFLPLNTGYTIDELSYFIEDSAARMVVCDSAAAAGLRPSASNRRRISPHPG